MDNLIRVYDNVIDSEYCKKLIDRFESNKQLHQSFDDRGMVFTQINIQKEGWSPVKIQLLKKRKTFIALVG